MIQGRKLYNFGLPERLRTLRQSIFTGGAVEENGICSACFLRKRGAAGTVKPSQSSLRDASSPERGSFIRADRQMAKSSPFGGAGERSEPERVGSLPEGAVKADRL